MNVFLLAQELANIVHRDVDLVDLSEASTVFSSSDYTYRKDNILFG